MKKILMLSILSIGMIGSTAFATTSEPEQKLKAELSYESTSLTSLEADAVVLAYVADINVLNTEAAVVLPKTQNSVEPLTVTRDIGCIGELKDWLQSGDVKAYNLHGKPLPTEYKNLPRGVYYVVATCDKDRKQYLVFKEDPGNG